MTKRFPNKKCGYGFPNFFNSLIDSHVEPFLWLWYNFGGLWIEKDESKKEVLLYCIVLMEDVVGKENI